MFSAHFFRFVTGDSKPRTVPGTPDDRQPSMLSVSAPFASRYMLRDAFRRALAEVDERVAVGHADQHVAAAAEVAGERMRDRHREADRTRVTALPP